MQGKQKVEDGQVVAVEQDTIQLTLDGSLLEGQHTLESFADLFK